MPATAVGRRERQIDGGVEQALAGEVVVHQHPGHDRAEQGVDESGGGRDEETHLQGRQHARGRGDLPDAVEAQLTGARDQHGERNQYDQRQVSDGKAKVIPKPGNALGFGNHWASPRSRPRRPAVMGGVAHRVAALPVGL